jgi:hypothetical protein
MPIKDSDNVELPKSKDYQSPFNGVQNDRILPRNMISAGNVPGKTDVNWGGKITSGLAAGRRLELNPNNPGAGFPGQSLDFYDENNVLIGSLFANSNVFFLLKTASDPFMKLNMSTGDIEITPALGKTVVFGGKIYVNGDVGGITKSFIIDHPTKPGYKLRYVSLEAPEVLAMCRGVCDTEDQIKYPQHFIDVTEPDTVQCQIGKLRGSDKISWIATGVRKGYLDFEPEYVDETSG